MSSRGRAAVAAVAAAGAAGTAAWLAARARPAPAPSAPLPAGRERAVRSLDGTEIHVAEFGPADATAVVLVHAWMCSLELWHRQISALAGEARLIAFDLRGHGRSGLAASGDYSIEAFAADLDAVLDATLADGDQALLAGHSMGAMTIAAWAHLHPEEARRRCSAVAMVGTGLGDLISEALVLRAPPQLTGAKERVERAILCTEAPLDGAPEAAVRAGARYVAFGADARSEDVALVAGMVRACDRRVRGQCGGTLSQMDVFDGLANLDVPASVVAGAQDRMTPPAHSHKLAEMLPRTPEVVEVPRAGHMVPLEADQTVTAELRRLLAESAPRSHRPRRRAVSQSASG